MQTWPPVRGWAARAGLLVIAAANCLGPAGCSTYKDPELSVAAAEITERSPEGAVISFTVSAANPNPDALPLKDASYTLELNGKVVFSATRSAESTLRRLGTQKFVLPAAVPASELAEFESGGLVTYRLSGTLQYVTPGALAELLFDTGVRQPDVSFSQTGQIDLGAAR
jgi:hypothetical protein